jgi:bacterioferritin (cytochrome b1)
MDENNNVDTLLNLSGLIKTSLNTIKTVKEEHSRVKEMLESVLENDPEYSEVVQKAKAVAKEKASIKSRIIKQPEAADLENKVTDLKTRLKDLKANLSDYLADYGRLSNSNQFEDNDGVMLDIVYTAKLVKRE